MNQELRIEGLSRRFGGVYALSDVSLNVERGEIRGIIGPNGAGKSTLFNLIAGHLAPDQGRIVLRDEVIHGLRAHERARRGVAIVHQRAAIFRGMSVLENVMVGAHVRARHGFLEAVLRTARSRREERKIREGAEAALNDVGLIELAQRPADTLPLGQQRSLQLARALAAEPTLLLLDEPASGLRAGEREHLAHIVRGLRARGLTVLLVEHDVPLVAGLSDKITVIDLGRVIAEGTPAAVRENPAVISAYLGAPDDHERH